MSAHATRLYYESGKNLAILRRHVTLSGAPIPEHPEQASGNPKFREYEERRKQRHIGGGVSGTAMLVVAKGPDATSFADTYGTIEIAHGLSKREASLVAKYWNAIGKYRKWNNTQAERELQRFKGKKVGAEGWELETRTDAIDKLNLANQLDPDKIYAEEGTII